MRGGWLILASPPSQSAAAEQPLRRPRPTTSYSSRSRGSNHANLIETNFTRIPTLCHSQSVFTMPENDGPEITLYRFRPPDSKIFDVVGSLSLLILTEVTVCEQTGMPFPYDIYTIQACYRIGMSPKEVNIRQARAILQLVPCPSSVSPLARKSAIRPVVFNTSRTLKTSLISTKP
jgi:hypothetical protein